MITGTRPTACADNIADGLPLPHDLHQHNAQQAP
ncbi:hypothetical protein CGZ88_1209 [Bifidobacterium anseris]|uniref:Uncharacterized protein n=1 Tax=Bifidobacterium anseris TaxID=2020963 RepID=A0A2N5IXP5_9BIFI|nr:hypothetical protein CGZ88_1209 [Bifidobacterium anseris]